MRKEKQFNIQASSYINHDLSFNLTRGLQIGKLVKREEKFHNLRKKENSNSFDLRSNMEIVNLLNKKNTKK